MKLDRYKILFVCTGNICRSPLAHAVFAQIVEQDGIGLQFLLESAGTHGYHIGEDADPRMRETAARHGYAFSHPARQVRASDLEEYDLIFAMDRGHYRHLRAMTTDDSQLAKIRMYRDFDPEGSGDVPDPYYGGQRGFEEVFDMVLRTSRSILEALQNYELP